MSTPALPRFSSSSAAASAEPTRKALRRAGVEAGHDANLEETLATLVSSKTQVLAKMPLDLLKQARSKLSRAIDVEETRQKEARQVEVLLPMDLLLHTFTFLSAEELHACRVCWYFERGVKSAVHSAILALDSDFGSTYFETIDTLLTMEKDVPRVQKLIASLDENMKDVNDRISPAANGVVTELHEDCARTAIGACRHQVFDKIEAFAKSQNAGNLVALRNELWKLSRRGLRGRPIFTQAKVTDRVVQLLFEEIKIFVPNHSLLWVFLCIEELPVSIIEANLNLIVPHAAHSGVAIEIISKVSTALLVQHDAAPVLTAYLESEYAQFSIHEGRSAKSMLDAIRTHLAGES